MVHPDLSFPMDAISALCRRYQIRELSLFGSALRDDFKSQSDVDLLVEFDSQAAVGFMALAKMQREFSALLQRNVDLIPKGGLRPKIRQAVLSNAKILYAA